jgi:hypothetical protein
VPAKLGDMTEQTEAPEAATDPSLEREITFRDRVLWVRMPSPEQLLVWKRTLKQLQTAEITGWTGEKVMAALERTRLIIDSVLLHDTDKEWMDDEMLAGNLKLPETSQIILLAVESFTEAGNREERRAAKKVNPKKAARKAAPTKKAARA